MKYSERFCYVVKMQLIQEFQIRNKDGVYAFTQKYMIYNSNKIERSKLTSKQTAVLFDTGTITKAEGCSFKNKDIEEMNGHFKMLNEILKNLDKPLSADMIKAFHFQLKSNVFEDMANGYPVGKFKNRPNQVSNVVTASSADVPAKIDEMIKKWNFGSQSLTDIVKFHVEYEQIHPFQDGNVRTGRAIIFKQCLDNNIIPIIIKADDEAQYYNGLRAAQTKQDYDVLIQFFEEEQNQYLDEIQKYIFSE